MIAIEAINKNLVTAVLDSAPDAVSNAADYQENVLVIAEFMGANDANQAAIDAIIKGKVFPHLISLCRGDVKGDARGGWGVTRKYVAFGDDIGFRCAANYSGIWWNIMPPNSRPTMGC